MKRFAAMLCLSLLLSMGILPAYAEGVESGIAGETSETAQQTEVPQGTIGLDMSIDQATDPEYVLGIKGGDYSVEHIGDKLKQKGMDIVYLLKIVGRWICIAAFVVCCTFLVFAIAGNTRLLVRSAVGAIAAGIMYAAITCGEEIVTLIAAWSAA